jgi:hypothetical protein
VVGRPLPRERRCREHPPVRRVLRLAAIDLVSAIARRAVKTFTPRLAHDVIAIVGGVGLALAAAWLHRILFGVRVVPFGL